MAPICIEMITTTDYLHTASDLEAYVAGQKAGPFRPAAWHPKVRGLCPDDGVAVGVAFYDMVYETKATATKRSREMLTYVKALRAGLAA